ncbi:caspase-8-like [Rhipicephalus microplus]|uniref:caspase-8-like n=1 Tax=Rhipicephalus microplus TaxID=6941 RepID=UPI003F6A6F48
MGDALQEASTSGVGPPSPRSLSPSGGSPVSLDVHSTKDGHGTVGEHSVCELQVIPAEEFKSGNNVYTMVHSRRGFCIIINNYDFGLSKREGSMNDVRRMKTLFKALHFKCIVHQDLTASWLMMMRNNA